MKLRHRFYLAALVVALLVLALVGFIVKPKGLTT